MEAAGEALGAGLPVSLQTIAEGSLALAQAARLRARKWAGGDSVRDIVEFIGRMRAADGPEGWYLTERGMFPLSRPFYFVEASRLGEGF